MKVFDTKLKDPVILNRKTKRIISIVRENHDKIDDPEHLKEFPEDNPEMLNQVDTAVNWIYTLEEVDEAAFASLLDKDLPIVCEKKEGCEN